MQRAMRALASLLVIATARAVEVTSYDELAAAVKRAEPSIEIVEPSLQIREALSIRASCTIECVARDTDVCFLEWTGLRQRGALFKIEGQNVVTMKRLWLFGHGASSRSVDGRGVPVFKAAVEVGAFGGLTLDACIVEQFRAQGLGAVRCDGCAFVSARNTKFIQNSADEEEYVNGRPPSSRAAAGGAVAAVPGRGPRTALTFTGCSFEENRADHYGSATGGAIECGDAMLNLEECEFVGNVAGFANVAAGGAIHGVNCQLVDRGSRFKRNEVGGAGSGGAILLDGEGASLWLEDTVVEDNKVNGRGTSTGGVGLVLSPRRRLGDRRLDDQNQNAPVILQRTKFRNNENAQGVANAYFAGDTAILVEHKDGKSVAWGAKTRVLLCGTTLDPPRDAEFLLDQQICATWDYEGDDEDRAPRPAPKPQTPRPTPQPVEACRDDPSWRYTAGDKGEKGCPHVAGKPEQRCGRKGDDDVSAREACCETCFGVTLATPRPSRKPTENPTPRPTRRPTDEPTPRPTPRPTPKPTPADPTPKPSPRPSPQPSPRPSRDPTPKPSPRPSRQPTPRPTRDPTPRPSKRPTPPPTPLPGNPSSKPTTPRPTARPTPADPTPQPTPATIEPPPPRDLPRPTPAPAEGVEVSVRARGVEDLENVSPSTELVLVGRARWGGGGGARAEWLLDGAAVGEQLRPEDLGTAPKQTLRRPGRVYLVIAPGALDPGRPYAFSLRVRTEDGAGGGELRVATNTPPVGGAFTISPDRGVALVTRFDLGMPAWQDDDLPLSYTFWSEDITGLHIELASGLAESEYRARLPAGESSDTRRLVGGVVSDAFGAASGGSDRARIRLPDSLRDVTRAVAERLEADAGKWRELTQTVVAGSDAARRTKCGGTEDCAGARAAVRSELLATLRDLTENEAAGRGPSTRQATAAAAATVGADKLPAPAQAEALRVLEIVGGRIQLSGAPKDTASGYFRTMSQLLAGGALDAPPDEGYAWETRGAAFAAAVDDCAAALGVGAVANEKPRALQNKAMAMAARRVDREEVTSFSAVHEPTERRPGEHQSYPRAANVTLAEAPRVADVAVTQFATNPRPRLRLPYDEAPKVATKLSSDVVRVRAVDVLEIDERRRLQADEALAFTINTAADADWYSIVSVNCSAPSAEVSFPFGACPEYTSAQTYDFACSEVPEGLFPEDAVEVICSSRTNHTCLRYVAGEDWQDDCELVERTEDGVTTCSCPAAEESDYAVASTREALLDYARDAFRDPLDGGLVKAGQWLLIALAGIAGAFLLYALCGWRRDRRDEGKVKARAAEVSTLAKVSKYLTKEESAVALAAAERARRRTARAHFLSLRAAAPAAVGKTTSEFRAPDFGGRTRTRWPVTAFAWTQLKETHEWLGIWFVYDPSRSRPARCAAALGSIVELFLGTCIACWYVHPVGLCEDQKNEESCENVRSFASFGVGRLCSWDDRYEDECGFRDLSSNDEFLLDLQAAVIGLAIAIPLVTLLGWALETYIYPKARAEGEAAETSRAEALEDAGGRLLASVGLDAADATEDPAVAASLALPEVMRVVLQQRVEIQDALTDASREDRAALEELLKAHDARYGCGASPGTFARRTARLLERSIKAAARWGRGLEASAPEARYRALCQLQYASHMDDDAACALYEAHASAPEDLAPPVSKCAKYTCAVLIFLWMAGSIYFMLFYARALGKHETKMWTGAALIVGSGAEGLAPAVEVSRRPCSSSTWSRCRRSSSSRTCSSRGSCASTSLTSATRLRYRPSPSSTSYASRRATSWTLTSCASSWTTRAP